MGARHRWGQRQRELEIGGARNEESYRQRQVLAKEARVRESSDDMNLKVKMFSVYAIFPRFHLLNSTGKFIYTLRLNSFQKSPMNIPDLSKQSSLNCFLINTKNMLSFTENAQSLFTCCIYTCTLFDSLFVIVTFSSFPTVVREDGVFIMPYP